MTGLSSFMFRWFAVLMLGIWGPLAEAATIVVVGDSISAGYGLEKPEQTGWVGLLRERLKQEGKSYDIVNASIAGDTSAGGVARLEALLVSHPPAILMLELGANDGLRGLAPDRLQANLATILNRARAAGAKTLLLGMRIPPNYGKAYNDRFEAVFPAAAKATGAAFVPFLLDRVGGEANLMQIDGLHPNAQAQPILLENVWTVLKPLL